MDASGRRGDCAAGARGGVALGRGRRSAGRRSGLAIGLVADFDSSAAGLQHVVDESWIPDLGVRYQLGVDGISVFLVLMTAILWFAVTLWSALRNEPGDGRSRLYYFLVGAGRDRRARRLHGPGPAAVRPLLRPDADPVLLPDRDLRRREPDRGDDEDDRLHAGRLAADAGRRDRHRDPLVGLRRRAQLLDSGAAGAPALDRQPGVDLLLLRGRFPGQDAGLPDPRLDARRLPRGAAAGADPALRRCSPRSAPTASCGSRCRSFRTPPSSSRRW